MAAPNPYFSDVAASGLQRSVQRYSARLYSGRACPRKLAGKVCLYEKAHPDQASPGMPRMQVPAVPVSGPDGRPLECECRRHAALFREASLWIDRQGRPVLLSCKVEGESPHWHSLCREIGQALGLRVTFYKEDAQSLRMIVFQAKTRRTALPIPGLKIPVERERQQDRLRRQILALQALFDQAYEKILWAIKRSMLSAVSSIADRLSGYQDRFRRHLERIEHYPGEDRETLREGLRERIEKLDKLRTWFNQGKDSAPPAPKSNKEGGNPARQAQNEREAVGDSANSPQNSANST